LWGAEDPLFVIATRDELGNKLYMVDPSGVYLNKGSSSQLRILGQQRMKRFGFDSVQNMKGDGVDYLVHRASGDDYKVQTNIPLITENRILLMATCGVYFTTQQHNDVKEYVKNMTPDDKDGNLFYFEIVKNREMCPVLVMNEGTLTDEEVLRLDHWRHAHRMTTGVRHKERCPACEQNKQSTSRDHLRRPRNSWEQG
jgi:hypothetical protein